ncbi:MAG: RecX family transcriptional regulator [Clostridia bacterium]|nr:RecX family transcriptional regulator [Clostridia bacterium]
MQITSVEKQKNKGRYSVYVDGSYSFSISEEEYFRLNLYEEKEISPEDIEYIKQNVNFNSAKFAAIKFLSLKIRTTKEVESRLSDNGFDIETINGVIEELNSMGYLNDKIYAQKYIYDRSKLKPKSKKLLKSELQSKGIEAWVIDEILDSWELDEYSLAEVLIRKKFGKYDLNDEKITKKAYSFLMHRGFSRGLIEQVVRKVAKGGDY